MRRLLDELLAPPNGTWPARVEERAAVLVQLCIRVMVWLLLETTAIVVCCDASILESSHQQLCFICESCCATEPWPVREIEPHSHLQIELPGSACSADVRRQICSRIILQLQLHCMNLAVLRFLPGGVGQNFKRAVPFDNLALQLTTDVGAIYLECH
jgi:hypothetical protein